MDNFMINATGQPIPADSSQFFDAQDVTVDPTGKFVLAVESTGVVHVFAIDPTTGNPSQIGTSEAAGNGSDAIAIDPSGRFVLVTQAGSEVNGFNQVTVFSSSRQQRQCVRVLPPHVKGSFFTSEIFRSQNPVLLPAQWAAGFKLAVAQAHGVHSQFFTRANLAGRPVTYDKYLFRRQPCFLLNFAKGQFFRQHVFTIGIVNPFD